VLCRRLAPTEADAQDLLQETLLAAFLGLGRLRAPDRLGGWLHTIAARQALRVRRRAAAGRCRWWRSTSRGRPRISSCASVCAPRWRRCRRAGRPRPRSRG
jgi:DNA-directed RNA polymerase specialized sigma24 family protein